MATPVGFYDYFLTRLGDWAMGIPLQSFWVVIIDFPNSVRNKYLNLISQYEPEPWSKFNTGAYGGLISRTYQDNSSEGEYFYGCMFARSINIPGEKTELVSPSIANASGLVFPNISKNRSTFAELDISFIETNSSFVDNVIRPWNILVSHLGLISRVDSIKGKIRVIFYAKPEVKVSDYLADSGDDQIVGIKNKPLVQRKVFVFNDVAPTTVSSQEYTQSGDALLVRPVKFTYSSYSYEAISTASGTATILN